MMTADADAASLQASMLEWMAGLLAAPPGVTEVAMLRTPEGRRVCEAMADELGCHDAMRELWRGLDGGTERSVETVALDVSVAYTRLFEGVAGPPAVSLYESFHATGPAATGQPTPQLFGPAAHEMADLLGRYDLSVGDSREPPDHAAIELAFYAALLRDGDAEGVALLRTRLAGWMPAFVAGCRRHDAGGFYGGLAQCLESLLGMGAPAPQRQGSHDAE
ncbi:TorD/DmsD family molecular chaperone [Cupriavidus agavae]|uniref:TorA-specific chaperone n=1 Tax=Cupriavidus agavae TaxID=1001822 RepID=A0A4Q7S7N6_9BURK|nr:molecular chaperone TorD family protein [Cupriavidus agavae]RZT42434.1 TorA-specific chaperone [Cupriavidus agavae]